MEYILQVEKPLKENLFIRCCFQGCALAACFISPSSSPHALPSHIYKHNLKPQISSLEPNHYAIVGAGYLQSGPKPRSVILFWFFAPRNNKL